MITSWKRVTRLMAVSLSSLLLVILLTACTINIGASASPTPTPTSAAKAPTPTPTTASTAPQTVPLQTYTGTGFTIQYPQNWKAQQSNQGGVVFTDAQQLNTVTIAIVPNPGGTISASQELTTALPVLEQTGNVSNVQAANLPATVTVGGESWAQKGVTGTVTTNGVAVPGELIGLADNHPASSPTTKTFEIYYGGPSVTFPQENALLFQPMIQTFKFTA